MKDLIRRLKLSILNSNIKPLSPEEMQKVLAQVLTEFDTITKSIKDKTYQGKQGKDGYTPVADRDYISKPRMEMMFQKEIDRVSREIQSKVKNGKDGKDAHITEKDIKEILARSAPMINEALKNARMIRNALETLEGNARLKMSAIGGLEEKWQQIQKDLQRVSQNAGRVGGGATKQFVIDYVAEHAGGGSGDMTKVVYDTNDDGTVDSADHATTADSATTAGTITNQGALATLDTVSSDELSPLDVVPLNTSYTVTNSEAQGEIYWDSANGTASLKLNSDVALQLGQETHYYIKASGAISNGDPVQFAGVTTDHISGKVAVGSQVGDNPQYLMGIATQDIADGAFGFVTHFGHVRDVNTTGWSAGDVLYFDTTSGGLTNVEPAYTSARIAVAAVEKPETSPASADGVLLVRPQLSMLTTTDVAGVNTGTSTSTAVTPDSLAGSKFGKRIVSFLLNESTALETGDGKVYLRISEELNGMNLVGVSAARVAGTGTPSIQIHNVTGGVDMLSTPITIDSGETDSSTATTPAVIDTSNDDVATADRLRIDVDDAGTDSTFFEVQLVFQLP